MQQQNIKLNIGDKIGFAILANDIDGSDETLFFPVVEICEVEGERAYRYQYPDGEISRSAIRQSHLVGHPLQIASEELIAVNSKMICLSEQKGEFREALQRSKNSRFEVYQDWERDSFVVINKDNGSKEYRVNLETRREQLFGECDCGDFNFRRRVCKHLSEVLTFTLFAAKLPVASAPEHPILANAGIRRS